MSGSGLKIPASGLTLRNEEQSGAGSAKPAQIMRLSLVQSTLDELIQSLRNDQPARVRLGKHPSLHYGGKSQSFHAYPETHRSEIYQSSTDDRTLYFTGVLSHSLEVEKAKQATAATDQALANLEESLNAFERGKESKKTHIIQHPDELKALRAAGAHRAPKSKAELEKDRLLRTAANRSLTSSPVLGAPKSPLPILKPTSAPASQVKNNARLEALKTPFIHLLAVRAVSPKFLSRQTCSSIEDCSNLATKYGAENRLNREKFDLKDKSYKDLDVWKFPYPNQEDRQQAIENAISAFDRMRISRSDKLWQMLLSKEERGKGKCLSRLKLSTGPIKKAAAPPRIQVGGAEDGARDEESTSNEQDRSASSSFSMGLDGAPPRSTPAAKKEPAKRPAKGKTTAPASNSTLTGRITKKTAGKTPAKVETKFKSEEFVHSSDDEDSDMPEATPPSPPAPPPPRQEKAAPPPKRPQAQKNLPKAPVPGKRPADTAAKTVAKPDTSTPKLEASQPRTASKKPASRQSTSPQKPSPLGSSPPANASDVQNRNRSDSHNQSSSSSSSSPLITQLSRANKGLTAARAPKPSGPSNGVTKSAAAGANPLKRKAEPSAAHAAPVRTSGNLDHKRRRAVSASSGGSTGSASPPMSFDIARQRLWERSQTFKRNYAKYRTLHKNLETQAHPSQADLDKLVRQHDHLQKEKMEIWEEDRRLREGILS
ncbi:hypothetical protein N7540_012288 [Penicillium herquei]|nr:hypothetical protein N7540_012288 [Penicillium herquei]